MIVSAVLDAAGRRRSPTTLPGYPRLASAAHVSISPVVPGGQGERPAQAAGRAPFVPPVRWGVVISRRRQRGRAATTG
jgi:hypothetical protein